MARQLTTAYANYSHMNSLSINAGSLVLSCNIIKLWDILLKMNMIINNINILL